MSRNWLDLGNRLRNPVLVVALVGAAASVTVIGALRQTEQTGLRRSFRAAAENRIRAVQEALRAEVAWLAAFAALVDDQNGHSASSNSLPLQVMLLAPPGQAHRLPIDLHHPPAWLVRPMGLRDLCLAIEQESWAIPAVPSEPALTSSPVLTS